MVLRFKTTRKRIKSVDYSIITVHNNRWTFHIFEGEHIDYIELL